MPLRAAVVTQVLGASWRHVPLHRHLLVLDDAPGTQSLPNRAGNTAPTSRELQSQRGSSPVPGHRNRPLGAEVTAKEACPTLPQEEGRRSFGCAATPKPLLCPQHLPRGPLPRATIRFTFKGPRTPVSHIPVPGVEGQRYLQVQLPLMCTSEAAGDGSSARAPDTHVRDLDGVQAPGVSGVQPPLLWAFGE